MYISIHQIRFIWHIKKIFQNVKGMKYWNETYSESHRIMQWEGTLGGSLIQPFTQIVPTRAGCPGPCCMSFSSAKDSTAILETSSGVFSSKIFFALYITGISNVATYVHCFWFYYCVSLRRDRIPWEEMAFGPPPVLCTGGTGAV